MIWHLPYLYQFDIINTYTPKFQKPNCWSAQLRWTWFCFQQFVKDKSFLWFIEVVFGDWCGYRRRLPKLCPMQPFAILYIKVHLTHVYNIKKITLTARHTWSKGEICPSRHSRRESKIFATSLNFSRNNAIYNINESTKYIFSWLCL